jgi:hypothetical protein
MVGAIDRCWLFTYQTPVEQARAVLPPALEPVTFGGCAFWNVVVCRLSRMRPRPLPAFLGVGYWHVAYRLYVRFHPATGPPLEGLYFARSDCDSRLIATAGNMLTDFRFHPAQIVVAHAAPATVRISVRSPEAPAEATVDRAQPPSLPAHSAFSSLEEAAAFLKYQPRGISVAPDGVANVLEIEREEAAWRYRLVTASEARWSFFQGRGMRPEICYEVEPIPYQWNRGRRVE